MRLWHPRGHSIGHTHAVAVLIIDFGTPPNTSVPRYAKLLQPRAIWMARQLLL
ncbi:MAG: hypothetical protein M1294_15075 [Firmicutes bacterium]|nr:hypothetical protein [Bacillota bacterium]